MEGHSRYQRFERLVRIYLKRWSGPVALVGMGTIYTWFGLLKVFRLDPVTELIESLFPFVDPELLVPSIGAVEIVIGIGFLTGRGFRIVLAAFAFHVTGTFLVLVLTPEAAFRDGNPLVLTLTGEFVIKNLALIAAAVLLANAHLERKYARRAQPAPDPD